MPSTQTLKKRIEKTEKSLNQGGKNEVPIIAPEAWAAMSEEEKARIGETALCVIVTQPEWIFGD